MGFDLTEFLKDEFLEDHVNKPITISGISNKYEIDIVVRDVRVREPRMEDKDVSQWS